MHNCTLVLSDVEVEEYLFRATLYEVQPGGFGELLQWLDSGVVTAWSVVWLDPLHTVQTLVFESSAARVLDSNYTSKALVAAPLPAPTPAQPAAGAIPVRAHTLTHVDAQGVLAVGSSPGAGRDAAELSDVVLITTNLTFSQSPAAAGNNSSSNSSSCSNTPASQLLVHLKRRIAAVPTGTHTLLGMVWPPVTLDLSYAVGLLTLPPDAPPRQLALVNLALTHLAQAPSADAPGAGLQTPGVWTQLLWAVERCVRQRGGEGS